MNQLSKALFIAAVLSFLTTMCYADFEDIGNGVDGVGGDNVEEGRFLGLLKKGKGRVETYTNYVPYPYPVPVAVPVYQNYGHHGGKLGLLGKGLDQGIGGGFGQGYYPGYPYQYSNIAPGGYGGFGSGFGPGYGYFK